MKNKINKIVDIDNSLIVYIDREGYTTWSEITLNKYYPMDNKMYSLINDVVNYYISKNDNYNYMKEIISNIQENIFKNNNVYSKVNVVDRRDIIIEIGTVFYGISCYYKIIINEDNNVTLGIFFSNGTYGNKFGLDAFLFIDNIDRYNNIIKPLLENYNKNVLYGEDEEIFYKCLIKNIYNYYA